MTADPHPLTPGQHFDLMVAVRDALVSMDTGDKSLLLVRFGFQSMDYDHGPSTGEVLMDHAQENLIALAEYLDIAVRSPADAEDQKASAANDVDAYEELVSAETALRDVIRIAVPNWQNDLTPEDVAKLEAKRTEEDNRRDGIAVSQDLLDYTEIYQLEKLIKDHWDPNVKAILDDKKRTEVYLGIIFDIRNSIGHSRPVFAAERLLLAGAAGQIRNQLARYRAGADGPQRHYPSLDSARDSMGNTASSNPYFSPPYSPYGPPPPPTPRLEVGDVITFELEATDPRGRELVWRAYSLAGGVSPGSFGYYSPFGQATGNRVQFTWTVSENEVGEDRSIAFIVANGGRYHRHHDFDDGCFFNYRVNPPPDA